MRMLVPAATLAAIAIIWPRASAIAEGTPATTASAPRPTEIYASDFTAATIGSEWSNRATTKSPNGKWTFLGTFGAESTTLALDNLPSHARVRLSFDFLCILTWDGDAYLEKPTDVGPDVFNVTVQGGPRLVNASFVCGPAYPTYTQSFPGLFPYDHVPGMTGAAQGGALGYSWPSKSVPGPDDYIYHIQRTFGHSGKSLQITFSGIHLQDKADECWGLDHVKVEVLPAAEPQKPDPKTLDKLWLALGQPDPAPAAAAIATLADLGDTVVRDIRHRPAPPPTDLDLAIQKLIDQLDDDSYLQREQATAALKKMISDAEPALRDALSRKTLPEETRARIESMLSISKIKSLETAAQRRERRLVEALELIGTKEARATLMDLAAHATGCAAYEAAQAAQRLDGNSPIPTKLELPRGLVVPSQ